MRVEIRWATDDMGYYMFVVPDANIKWATGKSAYNGPDKYWGSAGAFPSFGLCKLYYPGFPPGWCEYWGGRRSKTAKIYIYDQGRWWRNGVVLVHELGHAFAYLFGERVRGWINRAVDWRAGE
jgi:hypothetical protein